MIDAHLVMNVLNQMAARDFKQHGVEDPLLFALSDYLQEALRSQEYQGMSALPLSKEVRLLEVHAKLLAAVYRSELSLSIELNQDSVLILKPGFVARVVGCLLQSSLPQFAGSWHVQVNFDGDAGSFGDVKTTITFRNTAQNHTLDMAVAKRRLEKLCKAEDCLRSAYWYQDQPQQLQLVCNFGAVKSSTQ